MATINVTLERVRWMRDAKFTPRPDAVLEQVMVSAEYHRDHHYWVNHQRLFSWEGIMYPWLRRQTSGGPTGGEWYDDGKERR